MTAFPLRLLRPWNLWFLIHGCLGTHFNPSPKIFADTWLNHDFSRDVIRYAAECALFTPMRLQVHNDSSVPARRIRFVGSLLRTNGVEVRTRIADPPSQHIRGILAPEFSNNDEVECQLIAHDQRWAVTRRFRGRSYPLHHGVVSTLVRLTSRDDDLSSPVE